jgi:hypothetical protein
MSCMLSTLPLPPLHAGVPHRCHMQQPPAVLHLVGGHHSDSQLVGGRKLGRLGGRCACHARQLGVAAEEVLQQQDAQQSSRSLKTNGCHYAACVQGCIAPLSKSLHKLHAVGKLHLPLASGCSLQLCLNKSKVALRSTW